MPRIVPENRNARVEFFKARTPSWSTNATLIGTTAAAVTDLDTKIAAAEAARADQVEALAVAKTKTADFYAAVDAVSIAGAAIIKDIRGEGQRTNNPAVWSAAMIPAPAVPAPVPPPAQPTDFKVSLNGNADLIITWKASNPIGGGSTVYRVYRTIAGQPQTYLGDVGGKKYIDVSLPAGATMVTYAIQGVRSTAVGQWGNFVVKFGTNAGGETTASIMGPKLAA
jgi:hypothetical protein